MKQSSQLLLLFALACQREPAPSREAHGRSEHAAVEVGPPLVARPVRPKAGAVASPSSTTDIVPLEPASSGTRRTSELSETSEISLQAHFEWPTQTRSPRFGTGSVAEIYDSVRPAMSITLQADGRLDLAFTSSVFPLAADTRLQALYSNLGHYLVWPARTRYRVLPTGTLRALLRERRVDVTPIVAVEPTHQKTQRRFGFATEEFKFHNERGKLTLHVSATPDAGRGGILLCRLLLELLAISPETQACSADTLPTWARFDFSGSGALVFVVDSFTVKHEDLRRLEIPPSTASLSDGLPEPPERVVKADTLLRFARGGELVRTGLRNSTPYVLLALFDGLPLAVVAPGSRRPQVDLALGTYMLTWRTFFGEEVGHPQSVPLSRDSVLSPEMPDAGP